MNKDYDTNNDNYIPKHANDDNNQYNNWNNNINNNYNDFWGNDKVYNNIVNNYNKINDNMHNDSNSDINSNDINSNKIKHIKRKRKNSKVIWTVIMFMFIFIALACVVKLIFWNRDNKKTSSLIDNISSDTMIKEVDDSDSELVSKDEDKNSDYWYYITFPLIDVVISTLLSSVIWVYFSNADTPLILTGNVTPVISEPSLFT